MQKERFQEVNKDFFELVFGISLFGKELDKLKEINTQCESEREKVTLGNNQKKLLDEENILSNEMSSLTNSSNLTKEQEDYYKAIIKLQERKMRIMTAVL